MTEPINTFKTLDDVFDVSPMPIQPIVKKEDENLPAIIQETSSFPTQSELLDDYQMARRSMRTMLEQGEHVIENMIQIASQTESARSFEVAGSLIKTMSELAKDLVSLHEQTNKAKKSATEEKESPKTAQQINNTQTNNIVFQGTTTDLLKMVGNNDVIE